MGRKGEPGVKGPPSRLRGTQTPGSVQAPHPDSLRGCSFVQWPITPKPPQRRCRLQVVDSEGRVPLGSQEAGLAVEGLELGLTHTSPGALPGAGRSIQHTVGLGFVAEVKEKALAWMGWPQARTSSESRGQDLGRGAPEGREGEASKQEEVELSRSRRGQGPLRSTGHPHCRLCEAHLTALLSGHGYHLFRGSSGGARGQSARL